MKSSVPEIVKARRKYQIFWDRETLESARYLVAKCTFQECQWFHYVDRTIDPKSGAVTYYISGMLVPEQTVTGTNVETDGSMMLKLAMEMRETHGLMVRDSAGKLVPPTDEAGERIPPSDEAIEGFNNDCSRLAVWCHSHVQMACHPSGTDNEQWADWISKKITDENPSQPVLMFIFNQKDDFFCRLYDPVLGAEVEGATFHVYDGFNFSHIDELLKAKVKKKEYPASNSNNSNGSYTYPHSHQANKEGASSNGNFQQKESTTAAKTNQAGGKESQGGVGTDGDFKIAWTGASTHKLLQIAKVIHSSSSILGANASVKAFVTECENYFGDPGDKPESEYCWYIMDELLFADNTPLIVDMYAITITSSNAKEFAGSRERFIEHATHKQAYGPELFPVALEIAFGYIIQNNFATVADIFDMEWVEFENRIYEKYITNTSAKTKSKKDKNKNGNTALVTTER